MSKLQIIKAWKNPAYRASLSAEQRAMIPDNPAGFEELTNEDLKNVVGGWVGETPVTGCTGLVTRPPLYGCSCTCDPPTS